MKNLTANQKSWVVRMLRTFLQTAIGYLAVGLPAIDFMTDDISAIKKAIIGLGVSAVSAGIAAAMNLWDESLVNRAKAELGVKDNPTKETNENEPDITDDECLEEESDICDDIAEELNNERDTETEDSTTGVG
jgi:hypothetical protein